MRSPAFLSLISAAALACTAVFAQTVDFEPARTADAAADGPSAIVAPAQGRPQFVTIGGALVVVARISNSEGVRAALTTTRPMPQRVELDLPPNAAHDLANGIPISLVVPSVTPRQTWDLELRTAAGAIVARHAVAVCEDLSRIRLVHLSDMNIGEIGIADFEPRLIDEINLLAPTLIVATGDYLDISNDQPDDGWRRVSDFFARFDAPVLAACGDHDDIARYSTTFAPSPVGAIEIGDYRGIVLFDTARRAITEDRDQLAWLERTCSSPRKAGVTFVVAHDDALRPLRAWAASGRLRDYIRAGRIGLWFVGGHRDYDGRAQHDLLAAAAPLRFMQTQQSSGLARDGASGVAHFRVVDLEEDRAVIPHDAASAGIRDGAIPSLPVGLINVRFDGENDGSASRMALVATNNHPLHLGNLRTRVLLRAAGDATPWVIGGRLLQTFRAGAVWVCDVGFELPDKGAARIVVGIGEQPAAPDCVVAFDVPERVALLSIGGENAARINAPRAIVTLKSRGGQAMDAIPFVRLDGNAVPYRILGDQAAPATAYRVHLEPDEQVALQLDLSTVRVQPGVRELQVYVKGGPAWRAATTPLLVSPFAATTAAADSP